MKGVVLGSKELKDVTRIENDVAAGRVKIPVVEVGFISRGLNRSAAGDDDAGTTLRSMLGCAH